MNEVKPVDYPLNSQERYLYGINVRLDALIHMMSSFLEVYAKEHQIATTSNEIVEEIPEARVRKPRKK